MLNGVGPHFPYRQNKRLQQKFQKLAGDVHIVPVIKHNLLSINKFKEADYITLFDGDEVNIYNVTQYTTLRAQGLVAYIYANVSILSFTHANLASQQIKPRCSRLETVVADD